MSDEDVDVIDEKDRITGQAPKAVVHRQGLRHRVAAVLLQGEDGKYLIPTASRIKAEAGLLYHSAAGHVLSGESYVDSARRELLGRNRRWPQIISNILEPSGLKRNIPPNRKRKLPRVQGNLPEEHGTREVE